MPEIRRFAVPGRLIAALEVGLLVLAGCGAASGDRGPAVSGVVIDHQDGFDAAVPASPYPVAPQRFTSTAGGEFAFGGDTRGRISLVFFGYTHCPDTCQIVMSTIASAYSRLRPAVRDQVQVLFVTTDPAQDGLPMLGNYLARYNARFLGLRAPIARTIALGEPWGVYIDRGRRLPSGRYEVDHTTSVLGLDGRSSPQQVRLVWSAQTSPVAMAADITKLTDQEPKD